MGAHPARADRGRRIRRHHRLPAGADREIGYVVAVKGATSAYSADAAPQTAPYAGRGRPPTPRYRDPHQSCRDLAAAAGRAALKTVTE